MGVGAGGSAVCALGGFGVGVPDTGAQPGMAVPQKAKLKGSAGGDLADFRVFYDAAAKVFYGGLKHGAGEIVAVDVEAGERLGEAAQGKEKGIKFRHAGRRLGVNESRTPAVGVDEFDKILLGLRLDA